MKRIFQLITVVVSIVCLQAVNSCAQNSVKGSGRAVIYFEPRSSVIVRLDTMLLKQSKLPVPLKTGTYVIRAWAPTKRLFVDTIHILENRTTIVSKRLRNSEAYTKYREQMTSYRIKKSLLSTVPLSLTLGYSVYMYYRYNSNQKIMSQHLINAKAAAASYGNPLSAAASDQYKLQYDTERNSYEICRNRNNKLVEIGSICSSTALAATAVLWYLSGKIYKPAPFTETPLLSWNQISIRSDCPSAISLGIVVNINRLFMQ